MPGVQSRTGVVPTFSSVKHPVTHHGHDTSRVRRALPDRETAVRSPVTWPPSGCRGGGRRRPVRSPSRGAPERDTTPVRRRELSGQSQRPGTTGRCCSRSRRRARRSRSCSPPCRGSTGLVPGETSPVTVPVPVPVVPGREPPPGTSAESRSVVRATRRHWNGATRRLAVNAARPGWVRSVRAERAADVHQIVVQAVTVRTPAETSLHLLTVRPTLAVHTHPYYPRDIVPMTF